MSSLLLVGGVNALGEPVLDFSQYRFLALALLSRAGARCWSVREQSRRPGQLHLAAVSIGRVYRVGSVISRRNQSCERFPQRLTRNASTRTGSASGEPRNSKREIQFGLL
jgi:hypothetical protein